MVVGALDAPLIRQLVYIDPNWSEPRFETLNRGRLESLASDLEFEMMFLDDCVTRVFFVLLMIILVSY